jgi:hypothetical protein
VSPSDHAGSPETPKLLRELPNEAAEGREREAAAARKELPKNLQEALLLPVQERAQLVLDQRVAAMFVQPERWPEIVDSTAPFFKRRGIEPRLGAYARDAGVRAQVVLLAARFTVEELAWVAGNDPYLHEPGKGRGLATMSLEVVRRALAARKEQAPLSPATKRWEPPPEPEPKDLVRADEIGRFTADLVARRTA